MNDHSPDTPSIPIPIVEGRDAHMPIYYDQVYQLRQNQIRSGFYNRSELTDAQMGLVFMEKCHHVSTSSNSAMKNEISYRVRICKTCCQENGHIELGTFVDQESAILINEAHEILHKRFDKLCLLRKEDEPYLCQLTARKYDRTRGRDGTPLLELLAEKNCVVEDFKKRKRGLSIDLLIEASYLSSELAIPAETDTKTGGAYVSEDVAVGDESMIVHPGSSPLGYFSHLVPTNGASALSSLVDGATTSATHSTRSHDDGSTVRTPEASESGAFLKAYRTESSQDGPFSPSSQGRLVDEFDESRAPWDQSPRVRRTRGATFSYSPFVPAKDPDPSFSELDMSRIRTLTWLAGAGDDEVSAAQLLADLSNHASSKFSAVSSIPPSSPSSQLLTTSSNQPLPSTLPPLPVKRSTSNDGLGLGFKLSHGGRSVQLPENAESRPRSGSFDGIMRNRTELANGSDAASSQNDEYDDQYDDEDENDEDEGSTPSLFGVRRARSNSVPNIHFGAPVTVGAYSAEERQKRIERFLAKRSHRVWTKKVKYSVRKNFADSRIRVKGRFIRKEDEELMKDVLVSNVNSGTASQASSSSSGPVSSRHR